ncbi:MAG: hypothetical protein ACK4SM_05660 [Aquificaceae bacterium]
MKKILGLTFSLLGLFLLLVGLHTSFDIYVNKRQVRINKNVAKFIVDIQSKSPSHYLSYSEDTLIVLKTEDGKVIATENAFKPMDPTLYSSSLYKDSKGNEVYIYTKEPTLGSYIYFLLEEPLSSGIMISGVVIFAVGIFLLYMLSGDKQDKKSVDEVILNNLKALRVMLATSKVLPESVERAKNTLDIILKKYGGKK